MSKRTPLLLRHRLSDSHTTPELVAMRKAIEDDPANHAPPGGVFLYTPRARKKLEEIDHAIASQVAQRRKDAGKPVDTSGYSGRQTNRR